MPRDTEDVADQSPRLPFPGSLIVALILLIAGGLLLGRLLTIIYEGDETILIGTYLLIVVSIGIVLITLFWLRQDTKPAQSANQ